MITGLIVSNHIPPAKANVDFSAFKAQVDSLQNDSGSVSIPSGDLIKINTARKTTLQKDSVIAPLADAILDYRKRLGGFMNKTQLMEVPGMDSLHYKAICSCIYIDTAKIHKISLNKATIKKLEKYPYITHLQAESIINYRKTHGDYKTVKDLLTHHLVDRATYAKIAPYVTTE